MQSPPKFEARPDDHLEYKLVESNDVHAVKRQISQAAADGWALFSHQAFPGREPQGGIHFAAVLSRPRSAVQGYGSLPKRP